MNILVFQLIVSEDNVTGIGVNVLFLIRYENRFYLLKKMNNILT